MEIRSRTSCSSISLCMKLHSWKGKELKSSNIPSSHVASLFWAAGLGGLRWHKTNPLMAGLLLPPKWHLGAGCPRRCCSVLWLRDKAGRDMAQVSWKEGWDDRIKATRSELLLLPHRPRTFPRCCSGRVGTKRQQKKTQGSVHRIHAGFCLAVTSAPPNTIGVRGELFTL